MPKSKKSEVNLEQSVFDDMLDAFNAEEEVKRMVISDHCRRYPIANPESMDRQERYDLYGHC